MGTPTPNYGFMKPTVGADNDVWGNDYSTGNPATDPSPGLNGNWSKLDALLQSLENDIATAAERAQIPVGGLYLSTSDADPATNLGYGTWSAFAAGRALVGVGTANSGENPLTWAALQEAGVDDAFIADTELPAHEHDVPAATVSTDEGGEHTHNFDTQFYIASTDTSREPWTADGGSGGRYTPSIAAAGAHQHSLTIPASTTNTALAARTALAKTQPSIGVYVWLRTA